MSHSRYVLSEIISSRASCGRGVFVASIKEKLKTPYSGEKCNESVYFAVSDEEMVIDTIIGKVIKHKSEKIRIYNQNDRNVEYYPDDLDVVIDEPMFLVFQYQNRTYVAHRCRHSANVNEKEEFRKHFQLACDDEFDLINVKPSPIFTKLNELEQIAEINIKMINYEGKEQALEFLRACGDIEVVKAIISDTTFERTFDTKSWHEKPTDKSAFLTGLKQFVGRYIEWLKEQSLAEGSQNLIEFIVQDDSFNLNRTEILILIAFYCSSFSCQIYGHTVSSTRKLKLIDFEFIKENETVFNVIVNKNTPENKFRVNIINDAKQLLTR